MLLLPLIGNSSAERSGELSLVQSKLRENRVRYKNQIDKFNSQADMQERMQEKKKKEESCELERTLSEMEKEVSCEMDVGANETEEKSETVTSPSFTPSLPLPPPLSSLAAPLSVRPPEKVKQQSISFAPILTAAITPSSSSEYLAGDPEKAKPVSLLSSVAASRGSSNNSSNSSAYSSDTETSAGSWSQVRFNIPLLTSSISEAMNALGDPDPSQATRAEGNR